MSKREAGLLWFLLLVTIFVNIMQTARIRRLESRCASIETKIKAEGR